MRAWVASICVAACVAGAPMAGGQEAGGGGAPSFAPGVVTVIPPQLDREDALSVHDVVELRSNEKLQWTPSKWLKWESATAAPTNRTLYEMAKDVPFVEDLWGLEFSFKPLRMIDVDVPQASGRVQRKRIWYLVYRVRNIGAGLDAELEDDGEFVTTAQNPGTLHFIPELVLVSHDRGADDAPLGKAYLDRFVPAAMEAISRREFSGRPLLNNIEMAQRPLEVETGRGERGAWAVAMWEDVDPEIDFFSVYVGGLTNAYRWQDPPGAYKAGDPPGTGRVFARKKLQLNFWRPGDAIQQDEREIRYGSAPGRGDLYGVREGVAYRWVYR